MCGLLRTNGPAQRENYEHENRRSTGLPVSPGKPYLRNNAEYRHSCYNKQAIISRRTPQEVLSRDPTRSQQYSVKTPVRTARLDGFLDGRDVGRQHDALVRTRDTVVVGGDLGDLFNHFLHLELLSYFFFSRCRSLHKDYDRS